MPASWDSQNAPRKLIKPLPPRKIFYQQNAIKHILIGFQLQIRRDCRVNDRRVG
jgi:hypothetical protein